MDFDWTWFLSSILLPLLMGGVAGYAALRVLPLDFKRKRTDLITTLMHDVEKLATDLRAANEKHDGEMKLARNEIRSQTHQIELLQTRQKVVLKTQMRIRLEEEPVLEHATIEYVVNEMDSADIME